MYLSDDFKIHNHLIKRSRIHTGQHAAGLHNQVDAVLHCRRKSQHGLIPCLCIHDRSITLTAAAARRQMIEPGYIGAKSLHQGTFRRSTSKRQAMHVDGSGLNPKDTGRTRPDHLRKRNPSKGFCGSHRNRSGHKYRPGRSQHGRGAKNDRLTVTRQNHQVIQHLAIQRQGRIRVDQRNHARLFDQLLLASEYGTSGLYHGFHDAPIGRRKHNDFVRMRDGCVEHCQRCKRIFHIAWLNQNAAVNSINITGMNEFDCFDVVLHGSGTLRSVPFGDKGASIRRRRMRGTVSQCHFVRFIAAIQRKLLWSHTYPMHHLLFGEVGNGIFNTNSVFLQNAACFFVMELNADIS